MKNTFLSIRCYGNSFVFAGCHEFIEMWIEFSKIDIHVLVRTFCSYILNYYFLSLTPSSVINQSSTLFHKFGRAPAPRRSCAEAIRSSISWRHREVGVPCSTRGICVWIWWQTKQRVEEVREVTVYQLPISRQHNAGKSIAGTAGKFCRHTRAKPNSVSTTEGCCIHDSIASFRSIVL